MCIRDRLYDRRVNSVYTDRRKLFNQEVKIPREKVIEYLSSRNLELSIDKSGLTDLMKYYQNPEVPEIINKSELKSEVYYKDKVPHIKIYAKNTYGLARRYKKELTNYIWDQIYGGWNEDGIVIKTPHHEVDRFRLYL